MDGGGLGTFVKRLPRLHVFLRHCDPTHQAVAQCPALHTDGRCKGLLFGWLKGLNRLTFGKLTHSLRAFAWELLMKRHLKHYRVVLRTHLCVDSACVALDADPALCVVLEGLTLDALDARVLVFHRTLQHGEQLTTSQL